MKKLLLALTLWASTSLALAGPGDHIWSFGFGGPSTPDTVQPNAIAVDTSGNVIVTGQFQGTINLGGSDLVNAGAGPGVYDMFVAKYNSSGVHQWSKRFGGSGTADYGMGVGTDSSGNVYIVGQMASAVDFGGGPVSWAGNSDVFVLKLNSSGNYVAAFGYGGSGNETASGIAVLADGTYAITGSFGNFGSSINFGGGALPLTSGPDYFVAKFQSDGTHIWSKSGGATGSDFGLAIAMDTSGNVFATGYFNGSITTTSGPTRCPHSVTHTSTGFGDIFLAEYTSASGSLNWLNTYGGSTDDRALSISVGPSNEVVIGGIVGAGPFTFGGSTYSNNSNSADIFIAKYNSGGGWIWDKVFGIGTSSIGDSINSVAVDSAGNVVVTGIITSPLDMGGGILCPGCSTQDVFVAKFNSSGTYVFANRYSPNDNESGRGIDTDSSNNILITGQFFDQEDFGGGALTPNGNLSNATGFIAKFQP